MAAPCLSDLQTPTLLVRLDRVRANVRRTLELLGGDAGRWRPHVKTAKIPAVMRMLVDAGVRHFKCATGRELAVLLSAAGETPIDVLVAISHRGANLRRIAALAAEAAPHRVSVLTEDPRHAREARAIGPRLGLFVDLDPGGLRSGIPLYDEERMLATRQACGPAFAGLHCYEGHLHGADPDERARACERILARLAEVAGKLDAASHEVVTSGTPTFVEMLALAGGCGLLHRVSPGTVVYWDLRSQELGIEGFSTAAHVLARVVSAPRPDRVTADAGSKALDAAAGAPCARVRGRDDLEALTPSEEHLPLRITGGRPPAPGELLELVPRHVCPTVNLADEAVLLEGDEITEIVPVTARGHEVLA